MISKQLVLSGLFTIDVKNNIHFLQHLLFEVKIEKLNFFPFHVENDPEK